MTRTLLRATAMLALLSTPALAQTVSAGPPASTTTGASSSTPGSSSGMNTYVINPDGTFTYGAQGDAAWSGTGNGSGIAISKALYGLLNAGIKTTAQGTTTVGGSVAVSNFPATQPVSGTVTASVSNFPATQPVSGSVAVTNFPATQAVSGTVASLPAGVTTTETGGTTSTTQGTFTQAVGANASRNGCTIQNTSAGTLYVFFGGGTPSTVNSFQVGAGATSGCNPGNLVLRDAIQVGASIASATYVLAVQ